MSLTNYFYICQKKLTTQLLMISNLILSIFGFYFYFRHKSLNKKWSLFFLFMGFSAFVGGIYHGFPEIGEQYRFLSWSLLSTSLISAQIAAYQSNNNLQIRLLFILKSILLLYLSILNINFGYMVLDTAISLFGFIVIGNALFLKILPPNITYGILLSFGAAFFVFFKISFSSQHLNYNDIGHYISILSLVVISKGVDEISINELYCELTPSYQKANEQGE